MSRLRVKPLAEFQSQLDPDPNHHFPAVHEQLFNGGPVGKPTMQGFVKSYYGERKDVDHSRKIMYYFPESKLPVLTDWPGTSRCSTGGSHPFPDLPFATARSHTMAHRSVR